MYRKSQFEEFSGLAQYQQFCLLGKTHTSAKGIYVPNGEERREDKKGRVFKPNLFLNQINTLK